MDSHIQQNPKLKLIQGEQRKDGEKLDERAERAEKDQREARREKERRRREKIGERESER
jgi:hypothetical protein